jgi:hypothetical protein
MENPSIFGTDDLRSQLLAQYDAPAYLRRARKVRDAYEQLLGFCRKQREEWLTMVGWRLEFLRALAGGWEALGRRLTDEAHLRGLQDLHAALNARLRTVVTPTASSRRLRRAFEELRSSLERFNRRWREFVGGLDLSALNDLRDGYNRYYVLEKECALRSAQLARRGFRPLSPLTLDDLTTLLPPLPVPVWRE